MPGQSPSATVGHSRLFDAQRKAIASYMSAKSTEPALTTASSQVGPMATVPHRSWASR